ncbi:hypothetical protein M1B72_02635 [Geomonas paludis]|uniref:Uncharacterized protein n=1 Tax=Geomonas paludis TaxID=2740185 RepID=A0A6V8N2C8_9BACT|nr:protein DpdG [Geomonas paludis]UPU36620.1 hypothetical protein M1B72_02635 [Geomonas paludis]GFO65883.1 hypothetical protein GMPD_38020 [Geomonas paludis]
MAILNRTSDGLFNVLIVIYKVLAHYGPLSKDDVKSMVAPGDVTDTQVNNTLNRWTQLGLFSVDGTAVSITPEFRPGEGEGVDLAVCRLPVILRTIIFRQENNANFWDSECSASADFSRGISWLLAQDVYSFGTNSHATVQNVEKVQLADPSQRILQNDTRWPGLCHWATYLGFAWDAATLVVDPTVAVRESLPEVFTGGKTLIASSFLEALACVLPVLDYGAYRQEVETALNPQNWRKPPKFFLSTSLSRALKRLELSGEITLEHLADTGEAYRMMRQQGAEWGRVFTHVTWNYAEGK